MRHPYLLWTSLVAAGSGLVGFHIDRDITDEEVEEVNGEQVERKTRERQWTEFGRTALSGFGFVMSVVGIWGDGA